MLWLLHTVAPIIKTRICYLKSLTEGFSAEYFPKLRTMPTIFAAGDLYMNAKLDLRLQI